MKAEKDDRRSRRTRRLIVEALFALLLEKRYDRITVQDIIERADVGRSTFYGHYRDKDDVLAGEFERVLALLHAQELGAGEDAGAELLPSLALFRHVQEQLPLYNALLRGHGVEAHFQAAHRHLRQSVERRLGALGTPGRPTAVPVPILAEYVVGTFVTLLRWWLAERLPCSADQMHAVFRELVLPGVDRALGRGRSAPGCRWPPT